MQVPGEGGEDVKGGGEMRWKLGPRAPGERPASPGEREAAWQSVSDVRMPWIPLGQGWGGEMGVLGSHI